MKFLALDGNSIINRAFYGIKLLTTKDGRYTNGIYGFINILNRLIESESPDGVVVAFDVHAPTFRHAKYAEYKAGRKGMPQELRSQMPILKEWLDLMGYHRIEMAGYEADDILGTLAAAAAKTGDECVIATGDRDSLQLVSDKTRVVLTATKAGRPEHIDYTVEALFEKYGLSPSEMIELKALMGDSSDNIPGVAGVGEKTASDLIKRFGSIDYIYENIDTIDIKDSIKNKLISGRESAFLSRELGTINCSVPINTDIESYKNTRRDEAGVIRLMTGLEFYKLMENMGLRADFHKNEAEASVGTLRVVSPDEFSVSKTVDIVSADDKTIMVADGMVTVFDDEKDIISISDVLAAENIQKRLYDYKNTRKKWAKKSIDIKNVVFDALLAGYLANPSSSSYEIDRLASEYSVTLPKIDGDADSLIETAALHSGVCDRLCEELEKNRQSALLRDIEIPLAAVLADMETIGVKIDVDGIKEYGEKLGRQIKETEDRIYELVGYEFNLNSPKQLGVALFEKLCLPAKKKTKSGYSTSAEVLEELKYAHPAVELLLRYRQLAKLKSTYCDGLSSSVCADGRIRSTFNQTETRTGRISSLEPNLQNIPVRTEEGRRLRKFFCTDDGYVLCDADYSQIELRVLAHISDDKAMIEAFSGGVDIHTLTAATAFGLPLDMVTPLMRSRAKAVNFGIVYGIGAFSLSKDIGVTRKEADSYIKSYLSTYPGVDAYMKKVIESAKEDGFVSTIFGRRRYLPELSSSNAMLRSFGERVARNAPIQGTAADIIKIAMIKVHQRLKCEKLDARLILQVHDELIVECRENIKEQVCKILCEEMESAADMKVRLTVDAHYGKNWYDAKQ